MKTFHTALILVAALGLLAAAGCKQPLDLSMQRNRIFLMGRLLVGQTCNVRVIWRKAPQDPAPVTVTADLSQIGGGAGQVLTESGNGTWRWSGQVVPDASGEKVITITAVDNQDQKQEVSKLFRVFDTDKAIAIQAGNGNPCVALKGYGTVIEWQDYTGVESDTPAGIADVTAIAADLEGLHRLALKTDGTVLAWGCDQEDPGPCDVPEGLADIVAVAAGPRASFAVTAAGKVVLWGDTELYQIPPQLFDVVAVAAGSVQAGGFALRADGTVTSFNPEYYGKTSVEGLRNVIAISAGTEHVLALTQSGALEQINEYYVSFEPDLNELPLRVSACRATAVGAGSAQIALQNDGSVLLWAEDSEFNPTSFLRPTLTYRRFQNIMAVGAMATGGTDYLVLTEAGRVSAWQEPWVREAVSMLPVPEEVR